MRDGNGDWTVQVSGNHVEQLVDIPAKIGVMSSELTKSTADIRSDTDDFRKRLQFLESVVSVWERQTPRHATAEDFPRRVHIARPRSQGVRHTADQAVAFSALLQLLYQNVALPSKVLRHCFPFHFRIA